MKYRMILTLFSVLFLSQETEAGDRNRRGFIYGGGIGPAIVFHKISAPSPLSDYNRLGFGFEGKIGYGLTDRLLTYLTANAVIEKSGGSTSMIAFNSIGLTYYIVPATPSLYLSGGFHPVSRNNPFVGLGYEIKPGLSAEIIYITYNLDFSDTSMTMLRINFLRY